MDQFIKKHAKNPVFLLGIMVAGYALFTFLHTLIRSFLLEYNLCDFERYYLAARSLKRGVDIYQMDIGYHPLFFFLFKPFTLFPMRLAGFLYLLFLVLLIFLCIKLMADFFSKRYQQQVNIPVLFFLMFVTFSFQPIMEDLAVGQVNIILLTLFILMVFTFSENDILCGLFMSLMIVLKLQFALFFLLFFWKKRYKVIITAIIFYMLLTLFAALGGGFEIVLLYFKKIFFFLGPQDRFNIIAGDIFFFPCIYGVLARLFYNSQVFSMATVKILYMVLSAGLLIITFGYVGRKFSRDDENKNTYDYFLVILLMFLITPFTEEHHLTLIIPVFCMLFFDVIRKRNLADAVLYLLSFLLIGLKYSLNSFPAFHAGFLSLFSMGKFYGIVILYILTMRIMDYRPRSKIGA